MALLNYTTTITADTSLSEIQKILVKHGCRKITVDYDDQSNPCNLTFYSIFNNAMVYYSLPCRFDAIHQVLQKNNSSSSRPWMKTKEQAIKVGWRILKDWIEAQMALVETEMVEVSEVFMPYMITRGGDRLYGYIKSLPENNSPLRLNQ